jgi:nucleotide-binding universal stress UspA family protein
VKTILYATDYSDNSAAALRYAYQLSKALEASLVAMHVFDYPTVLETEVHEPFPHLEEDAFEEHRKKLRTFCASRLNDPRWEDTVEMEVVESKKVAGAVAEKALELGSYLLVVGMKGGSSLREFLMGNTTKKLISEAPCPVLSVPEGSSFNGLRSIVYATDFEEEDVAVLNLLVRLAAQLDASVRAVHIASEKEIAGTQRKEWFEGKLEEFNYPKLSFEAIGSEETFETLRVYLGDHNADLVVMLERDKGSLLRRIFHRDMVKRMEAYGRIPLLAFHEKNFREEYSS